MASLENLRKVYREAAVARWVWGVPRPATAWQLPERPGGKLCSARRRTAHAGTRMLPDASAVPRLRNIFYENRPKLSGIATLICHARPNYSFLCRRGSAFRGPEQQVRTSLKVIVRGAVCNQQVLLLGSRPTNDFSLGLSLESKFELGARNNRYKEIRKFSGNERSRSV
jgi:hypothetical protein